MYSKKQFTKDWKHFCSWIDFGKSAMDAEAIRIMNEMPGKVCNILDAAPELLEALKKLKSFTENILIDLDDTQDEIESQPMIKLATEAIAKAE